MEDIKLVRRKTEDLKLEIIARKKVDEAKPETPARKKSEDVKPETTPRRTGTTGASKSDSRRRRKPPGETHSTFTELQKLLQEMRPSTLQVLRTPYFRNCKAARNMRRGVRQIREFCKQVRLETVSLAKKRNGDEPVRKRQKTSTPLLLEDTPGKTLEFLEGSPSGKITTNAVPSDLHETPKEEPPSPKGEFSREQMPGSPAVELSPTQREKTPDRSPSETEKTPDISPTRSEQTPETTPARAPKVDSSLPSWKERPPQVDVPSQLKERTHRVELSPTWKERTSKVEVSPSRKEKKSLRPPGSPKLKEKVLRVEGSPARKRKAPTLHKDKMPRSDASPSRKEKIAKLKVPKAEMYPTEIERAPNPKMPWKEQIRVSPSWENKVPKAEPSSIRKEKASKSDFPSAKREKAPRSESGQGQRDILPKNPKKKKTIEMYPVKEDPDD